MAIRRGKRPDTRFYTVNKDISEDTRLSWAARGMLIFLLGKPDNWTVSVAHLIKQTVDSQRSTGRDGVRAIIKELIDAGYMQADGVRSDGGTFAGMNYVVSESPETANPAPVKPNKNAQEASEPGTANPSPDKPASANPRLIKNDHHQGMKELTKNDLTAAEKSAPAGGENGQESNGKGMAVVLSNQQQENPSSNGPSYEKIRAVFWEWFDEAYSKRYNATLPRNTKTNSQVKKLIDRLGKEAPGVARFYVENVSEPRVLMASHTLDFLLLNAEGYRTQWLNGRTMTNTRARQIDQTQANASAADEAIAMLRAKRAREAANGSNG